MVLKTGQEKENFVKCVDAQEPKQEQFVPVDNVDMYGDDSDFSMSLPTSKDGIRRKHHRPWTLSEVIKLVEGVSKYGAGRWSEIKKVAFASYNYRTSVDLKVLRSEVELLLILTFSMLNCTDTGNEMFIFCRINGGIF